MYICMYVCMYVCLSIYIHVRCSAGQTSDQGALQCQARAASAARSRPGGTAFTCFTGTKVLSLLVLLVQKFK